MKSKSSMGSKILESNESIESIYSAEFFIERYTRTQRIIMSLFCAYGVFCRKLQRELLT